MSEEKKFVVRMYDSGDHGWFDVKGDMTKEEADVYLDKKTKGGTVSKQCCDGDYYKIFPANTRMIYDAHEQVGDMF